MSLPEIGDMWQWTSTDNTIWTVLVMERGRITGEYRCLCVDDGEIETWDFTPSNMKRWKKLA